VVSAQPGRARPRIFKKNGYLEKVEDFEYNGVHVPASRLGYRMTDVFCYKYLGKLFDEPQAIFSEDILRPELQSMQDFVDGVLNIANGHKKPLWIILRITVSQDAIPADPSPAPHHGLRQLRRPGPE